MPRGTKNSLSNPTTTLASPITSGDSGASIVTTSEMPVGATFSVNIGNEAADQEVIDCSYDGSTTLTFVGVAAKSHAVSDPVNIVWSETDYNNFLRVDAHLDTDNTLAADSDSKVASQKAVKKYVDDIELTPGPQGEPGIITSESEPASHDFLWFDPDDVGPVSWPARLDGGDASTSYGGAATIDGGSASG